MRTIGRRQVLILLACALIVALVLSVGSLDRVHFAAGEADAVDGGSTAQRSPLSIPASRWMAARNVVFVFTTLVLLALSIAAFLGRAYRRILIWTIIAVLLLSGFVYVLQALDSRLSGGSSSDPANDRSSPGDAGSGSNSPWGRFLAAGLIAVAATLLAVLLGRRVLSIWRRVRCEKEFDDLMVALGDAALQLREGGDPHSIVLRCYREMLRVLSRDARIAHEMLTPREFAAELERYGMSSDHVLRLTELFELVRYGRRDDLSLADRALTCLDEIRAAHLSSA